MTSLFNSTETTEAKASEIPAILAQVEQAGYKLTKMTNKIAEYKSPTGQIIYVVKTTSRLNHINLMVHPDYTLERLSSIQGVGSVSHEHRFHSNMTSFPKRINKGKTKTAFGWQVNIESLGDLPRFLAGFQTVPA